VHSLIERIAVDARGGSELVEVIATNVFVRLGGGWRILVHHAGVTEGEEAVDEAQDDDEDDDGLPSWVGARRGVDRPEPDDDDAADGDLRRPPPGRLH
jgi:hypothetical protein